jgi:hypothetical protein
LFLRADAGRNAVTTFIIASAAKQSRAVCAALDCFAALAMTRVMFHESCTRAQKTPLTLRLSKGVGFRNPLRQAQPERYVVLAGSLLWPAERGLPPIQRSGGRSRGCVLLTAQAEPVEAGLCQPPWIALLPCAARASFRNFTRRRSGRPDLNKIEATDPFPPARGGVLCLRADAGRDPVTTFVIARSVATKQSRAVCAALDCFAALAMTRVMFHELRTKAQKTPLTLSLSKGVGFHNPASTSSA